MKIAFHTLVNDFGRKFSRHNRVVGVTPGILRKEKYTATKKRKRGGGEKEERTELCKETKEDEISVY